jgi:hypothetical protein
MFSSLIAVESRHRLLRQSHLLACVGPIHVLSRNAHGRPDGRVNYGGQELPIGRQSLCAEYAMQIEGRVWFGSLGGSPKRLGPPWSVVNSFSRVWGENPAVNARCSCVYSCLAWLQLAMNCWLSDKISLHFSKHLLIIILLYCALTPHQFGACHSVLYISGIVYILKL